MPLDGFEHLTAGMEVNTLPTELCLMEPPETGLYKTVLEILLKMSISSLSMSGYSKWSIDLQFVNQDVCITCHAHLHMVLIMQTNLF